MTAHGWKTNGRTCRVHLQRLELTGQLLDQARAGHQIYVFSRLGGLKKASVPTCISELVKQPAA